MSKAWLGIGLNGKSMHWLVKMLQELMHGKKT